MKHVLRKKTVFKRTTAVFLTMVMAFSLIPQDCLVVEASTPTTEWESDTSLPTEAGSYMLTDDVTLAEDWNVNAEIELDLNGCSIRMKKDETTGSKNIKIENQGNLTLNGAGAVDSADTIEVQENGGFLLNGPNITANGFSVSGTAELTDGIIKTADDSDQEISGSLTLNGATLELKKSLAITGEGTLNVTDGYVTSESGNAVKYADGSAIAISGGYFKSGDGADSDLAAVEASQTSFVSSGYFSKAVADEKIAENCICVGNSDPETAEEYPYVIGKVIEDELPAQPGIYILKSDITSASEWKAPGGATKIILNGCQIEIDNTIIIEQGASLVISDGPDKTGELFCQNLDATESELTVEAGSVRVEEVTILTGTGLIIKGGTVEFGEVGVQSFPETGESYVGITGGEVTADKIRLLASFVPDVESEGSGFAMSGGRLTMIEGIKCAGKCMVDISGGELIATEADKPVLSFDKNSSVKIAGGYLAGGGTRDIDYCEEGTVPASVKGGYFKNDFTQAGTDGNDRALISEGSFVTENVDTATKAAYPYKIATLTDLSSCEIVFEDPDATYSYTGEKVEPVISAVQLTNKDETVTTLEKEDYTISYENNINAGTATITVAAANGSQKYFGSKTVEFEIESVVSDTVVSSAGTYGKIGYDGTEKQLFTVGGQQQAGTLYFRVSDTGVFEENDPWTAYNGNNIPAKTDCGRYSVQWYVEGNTWTDPQTTETIVNIVGKYSKENPRSFDVMIAAKSFTVEINSYSGVYDGQAHTAGIEVAENKEQYGYDIIYSTESDETKRFGEADATKTSVMPAYTNAGNYTVYFKVVPVPGNKEYTEFSSFVEIVISKRPVIITPVKDQKKIVGSSDPTTFFYEAEKMPQEDNGRGLIGEFVPEGKLTRVKGETVGEYAYKIDNIKNNAANSNYNFSLAADAAKFAIVRAGEEVIVVGDTLPDASGRYRIEKDYTIDEDWELKNGQIVIIDLNGHTIDLGSNLLKLDTSAIVIQDSSEDRKGVFKAKKISVKNISERLENDYELQLVSGNIVVEDGIDVYTGVEASFESGSVSSGKTLFYNFGGDVFISGGTYKCGTYTAFDADICREEVPTPGETVISSGLFNKPVQSKWLAEGCECITNTDPVFGYSVRMSLIGGVSILFDDAQEGELKLDYTGEALTPAVSVMKGKTKLVEGKDYTIAYADNINAGEATVTITAAEGTPYTGSKTATFIINKIDSTYDVAAKTNLTVTGSELELVTVTGKGGTVKYRVNNDPAAPSEFTSEIPKTAEAGIYTIEWYVAGDNNYKGLTKTNATTGVVTEITQLNPNVVTVKVKDVDISVNAKDYTGSYDGAAHKASVEASGPKNIKIVYSMKEDEKLRFVPAALAAGVGQYDETMTQSAPSFKDAGKYTVYYKVTAQDDQVDPVIGSVKVVIEKKQVTVTPDKGQSKFIGKDDPEFTFKLTGLVGNDTIAVSLGREEGEEIGTYGFILENPSEDAGNYKLVLDDKNRFEIKGIPVENVEAVLDKTTFKKVGETAQITVTVSPEDATNKEVTFESSDGTIAEVDETGKVTVYKNGDVVFTITAKDGKKTELKLSVSIDEINEAEAAKTEAEKAAAEKAAKEAAEKAALDKIKAENKAALDAGLKVKASGRNISVAWGKVSGATSYRLYMAKLGGKYPAKVIKTLKSTATRITKFNNRKLDGKGVYTIYVVAMKREGGKETELAKSIVGIVAGGKNAKYTNVRSITLKTKTLSVAVGASAKIKAKTVRVDKKKKLADKKTKEFRYASSDNSIATVDENGNVTGVKAGTCKVYVYSKNGLAKAVSVTVK